MKKKLIISVIILVVLIGGYEWLASRRMHISALAGKIEVVKRGDLTVRISAGGRIRPAAVAKIKGKASGEVLAVPFEEGQMVEKGELIVQLDKRDEERRRDQAETDVQRANHAFKRAELAKKESENAGINLAKAHVSQADARLMRATVDLGRLERASEQGAASPQELRYAEAAKKEAVAALQAANAELAQAEIAPQLAQLDIDTALQAIANANKVLEEAEQRLEETEVISPIDGMVLKRHVVVGEVVQSGVNSLTGGTVLIEIADVSDLYAMANVDEADIGLVRDLAPPEARPGPTATQPVTKPAEMVELPEGMIDMSQTVRITIESFPDEEFFGVIERISPQSEIVQAIATFKVAIRITSDNRSKLIGLLDTHAEATFTSRSVIDKLLVPYEAVYKDPNSDNYGVYVTVPKSDGSNDKKPEFRKCRLGMTDGVLYEVIEGIGEGEEVYVRLPIKTAKQREQEEREKEQQSE